MNANDTLELNQRAGLPDALRVLVTEIPREAWQAHPNFGGMVEFWLQRHMMFRQILERMERDVQAHVDGHLDFKAYAPRLSRYGGMLLNELHGHHQIEDHHYFPRLVQLDRRIEAGFDLLEADHGAMDGLLHDMAGAANAVLQGGEAGVFSDRLDEFGTLLNRHLVDEEDIIVPVILKSGFDG
ncbi:hemerythrin domain-containing protein [Arenibacterium sp. CAU 1754]